MPDLVLIVDDELSIVQPSRMFLGREGFNMEPAGDGGMAMEAAARLKPALMLLDVMLPNLPMIHCDGDRLRLQMITVNCA